MKNKTIFSLLSVMILVLISASAFAQVVISPASPNTNADLTCSIPGSTPSLYIYQWYKNGAIIPSAASNVISNIDTNRLDIWTCKMYVPPTPYTGTIYVGEASTTIINSAPSITSTTVPINATEGSSVALTASAYDNVDNDAMLTWNWNFGDGQTATETDSANTHTTNHIYQSNRSTPYTLTVTVTDAAGASASLSNLFITILDAAPVADFAYVPNTIYANQTTVNFTDLSTTPADLITSWNWNFGDGVNTTYATAQPIVYHNYTNNATYPVTLTITDADGSVNSTTRNVTVLLPLPLTFGNVIVNELMHNVLPANKWIELYNNETFAINVTGWTVNTIGGAYTITGSALLPAKNYSVLTADPAAFAIAYPSFSGTVLTLNGLTLIGNDNINITNSTGSLVDLIDYRIWYTLNPNAGYSIELNNLSLDNNVEANWHVSTILGGTPGSNNTVYVAPVNNTSAPNITNILNYSITNQSAIINWTTDDISNSSVNVNNNVTSLNDAVTQHSITLTNLTNGTFYSYNVTSCNIYNNCSTSLQYNFTTLQSNVTIPVINLTINSINAVPNPAAQNATMNISANVTGNISSVWIRLNNTNYAVQNTGNIYYNDTINISSLPLGMNSYIVFANDTANVLYNRTGNFTIYSTSDLSAPVITITGNTTDNQSATINYNTNVLSNATLLLLADNRTFNSSNNVNHIANIAGLVNGTLYQYNITACNVLNIANCTTNTYNFTTIQNNATTLHDLRISTTLSNSTNGIRIYNSTPALIVVDPASLLQGQNYTLEYNVLNDGTQNETARVVVSAGAVILANYSRYSGPGGFQTPTVTFNASSLPLGLQNITVNVAIENYTDATPLNNNVTREINVTGIVIPPTYNISINNITSNSPVFNGTNAVITANVTGNISNVWFVFNGTTYSNMSNTSDLYTVSIPTTANGTFNYMVYANSTNNTVVNSTTRTFTVNPIPTYVVFNSTINGVSYPMNTSAQVGRVDIYSLVNLSTITITSSWRINNSDIINSTVAVTGNIVNSTVIDSNVTVPSMSNCTILYSTYTSPIACVNVYIDPSTVLNSNVTGSTITNSTVINSTATYSTVGDSNITSANINNTHVDDSVVSRCTIRNSDVDNANINGTSGVCTVNSSTLANTNVSNSILLGVNATGSSVTNTNLTNVTLNNAVIVNNNIINGTVTLPNGYVASNGTVPRAPVASFTPLTSTSRTVTFRSTSTDANNDTLSYVWALIGGNLSNTSSLSNQNITYAFTNYGTYRVNLTVTDTSNLSSTVSVNVPITQSTPSGGGGSSSSNIPPQVGQSALITGATYFWNTTSEPTYDKTMRLIDYIVFEYLGTSYSLTVDEFDNNTQKLTLRISPTDEIRKGFKGDVFDFTIKDKKLLVNVLEITQDPLIDSKTTIKVKMTLVDKEQEAQEEPVITAEKIKDGVIKVVGEIAPPKEASVPVGIGVTAATLVAGLLLFFGIRKIWN